MARESKRKRDERRFGKPERLVDRVMQEFGNLPYDEPNPPFPRRRNFADFLGDAVAIEATNVAEYFLETTREKGGFDLIRELPCLAPPFDHFFVEMFQRQIGNGTSGWLFFDVSSDELREKIKTSTFFGSADFDRGAEAKWWLWASSVYRLSTSDRIFGPFADALIFIGPEGNLIIPPAIHFNGKIEKFDDIMFNIISHSLVPACLSVCFMNCRRTHLDPVDPDREINRERRKHGLRPFLRYHTINIEPMKKVLRTEGNIEANGLKKALHIVRGHFTHYSEERPLFGRPGLHGTFWTPAHTRGSLDEGIVVSDYNVKAPANP